MAIREPSFTIGMEEEYLLVDKETRDLAQEPPAALLAKCQQALPGQVSPEFLRSQIEVGTKVCRSIQEARADLIRLRSTVGSNRRRVRPRPYRRLDASFRPMVEPAAHRQRALQRACSGFAASGAAPRHLRHARPCRHRRRRAPHRYSGTGRVFPAASARALDLLAVLAGQRHGSEILPACRVRRAAAHRHPASIFELQRISPHCRASGQRRADRGRDQALVGFAALGAFPDARNAHHRCLSAARRRYRHRRPVRLPLPHALSPAA